MTDKQKRSYKTISEVVKILNTNKKISSNSQSHTLRFWEKQFKQINKSNSEELIKKYLIIFSDKISSTVHYK